MSHSEAILSPTKITESQERDVLTFVDEVTLDGRPALVCCPYFLLDALDACLLRKGYHSIDCELFRARSLETDEFSQLIGWESRDAFALFRCAP